MPAQPFTGAGFDLNCSIALPSTPVTGMAARAREAGFDAVEFWWPFPTGDPTDRHVDAFVDSVLAAQVRVVSFNFFGGGADVGGRGLAAVPGRQEEFLAAARRAVAIGRRIGVTVYNPMFGEVPGPWDPRSAEADLAVRNLREAERVVADAGAVLAVEPLSGFPDYPLRRFRDALDVVDRVQDIGGTAVGVLADLFHLHTNGDDVEAVLGAHADRIAHVQIADAPGRVWPGGGRLPLTRWIDLARASGYGGSVGLECHPR